MRLQQPAPRAGYAPCGVRAVAKLSGKYVSTTMISALSNGGQLHFSPFDGKFSARTFTDYLQRLIDTYPERKIILICANDSTHHAKNTKAWVAAHAQRIELVFLPALQPAPEP